MTVYIPIINCGINSGSSPMYFTACNLEPFSSEEDCENWISQNRDNFSLEELGGGIYAAPFDTEVLKSYGL